ncbi:putative signal transducing protein [Undibacterium macrobrachii]|jgi:hypothetical protein|uniref:DUF2007 domain-containing protein n=1 Tax=Undibacterium macrobrachii TaxID=1119058 RepID=A0ABQ2XKB9_9BURK|nr:DUF2007 domain-containing protein [Undibacterium macrobrachii]GGX21406.1 hypothetical protein GCM10011282_29450 [Undibacterium macrobrachii]
MQTIYQASNNIEAHMVKNMLEQHEINAFIEGEFLQGGVGDLPAHNLVRILVAESDFANANQIIDEWNQSQETYVSSNLIPTRTRKSSLGLIFLGLLLGLVLAYAFSRTPYDRSGYDYNYDGRLDDQWTYSPNGVALLNEVDRNLDGKLDLVFHFDKNGLIESAEFDDNFDGVFESTASYENGNITQMKTDTDGDHFADFITNFKFGVATSIEYINVYSGYAKKICSIHLGKIKICEIDTNLDRVMDKKETYDENGEINLR